MEPSESKENLVFDHYTIRLLVGAIAFAFPWVVSISAGRITPSISWSYYTDARDLFVGLLFVIGAFLISYKGHQPVLGEKDVGKFWRWVETFWQGAIHFRICERKHEEDWVSSIGGIGAWFTALNPTAFCVGKACPPDPTSIIHYVAAVVLFSTTVYFCLIAFRDRAKAKIKPGKSGNDPIIRRIRIYWFCGWGIAAIMLGSVVAAYTQFDAIRNFTFWAEAVALILFGVAWVTASKYLPGITDETERQQLFWNSEH